MKRILVTRPRAQANGFADNLKNAGFEPVFFPVIEIGKIQDSTALDRALRKLECYDWVIFTSVNAVKAVWERLEAMGSGELNSGPKIAAIGPKTAAELQRRCVVPDFVPEEYVAEAILPGLGDLRGRWVLLPRADIARKTLPEAISAADGVAHEIVAYHTLPGHPDVSGLVALRLGVDVITFTSPSTVQNFIAIVQDAGLDPYRLPGSPLIACIGPITARAAEESGLSVDVMAEEYTTEGLVQALIDRVRQDE